jgi:cholesterol oxidase
MRAYYDVVVVGSGFGGAVAACRLAQAGQDVAVLERGRRYGLGEFPRSWDDAWFWRHGGGPFDVRPLSEVIVVQAAGYGGGSLLYSNVHLRLPREGFEQGWPTGWTRESLDPYYDVVAYMLDISPVSEEQPLGVPPRTTRMQEAASDLHRDAQFFRPPLAVNFADPDSEAPNRFGVNQRGCNHCGECSIGCNTRAKNTLDLNYLALAEGCGAEVGTGCEVTEIAEYDGRYELRYLDHNADGSEHRIEAGTVVLAAGAVNTTELLLHCRDRLGTLPGLSDRLGEHYSANGDFLSFALGTRKAFGPASGPAITSSVLYSAGPSPGDPWFLLQDGGFPRQFASIVSALDKVNWLEEWLDGRLPTTEMEWLDRLRQLADQHAESADLSDPVDCAVFLGMGRDSSDGRIRTLPGKRRHPWLNWSISANRRLYDTEQRLCDDFATALGGDPVSNPAWRFLRLPVGVHNLGGCVMADEPSAGVVNPHGEVFGCPNLYVFDGAALPRATGVNPSHTIAAVAERNVERLARKLSGNQEWRAPEWEYTKPYADPVPPTTQAGTIPATLPKRVLRACVAGRGSLEFVKGIRTVAVSFDQLVLATTSIHELAGSDGHILSAHGEVHVHGLGPSPTVRVDSGVVSVERNVGGKTYWVLPFSNGENSYVLGGWSKGRTLRLELRDGPLPTSPVLAVGFVQLDIKESILHTVRSAGPMGYTP